MKELKGDLQAIVDLCLEEYGLSSFPVNVKRVQRGRCNRKSITLPQYLLYHHEAYQIYYAVHEATHKITGCGHGRHFKHIEDLLLEKFGIKIERKKAYPGSLWFDDRLIIENDTYTVQGQKEIGK